MSEKNITELEWKRFSKGRGLKDAAFVKALAALETGRTPEAKLAALADIETQAELLRKSNKADKELGSYLDDAEKAAGKERKLQEAEARKSTAAYDEDEDSPALLSTRMIPLLRELQKGEVTMPALICISGKSTALLVMRRAIAPARRKMLAESLDAKGGGAKFITGECRYEDHVLTFIVQGAGAGLAKRLRQALYDQTDLRLKVRVRGDDGDDDEHDSDGEHGTLTASQVPVSGELVRDGGDAKAYAERRRAVEESLQAALRSEHPELTKLVAVSGFADDKAKARDYLGAHKALDMLEKLLTVPPAPPVPNTAPVENPPSVAPVQADTAAFNHRLSGLMPAIKQILADGGALGAQIKLKVSEAGMLARKRELANAGALLDEVEALLAQTSQGLGNTDVEGGGDETDVDFDDDLDGDTPEPPKSRTHVAYTQTRLDWDQARKHVLTQLGKLKSSIVEASAEESDFTEIRDGVGQLYEILEILDERLIDKLDEALNAAGDARAALQREASGIVGEYLDFVSTNALMQDIDRNGFVDVDIQRTLMTRLRRMDDALLASD